MIDDFRRPSSKPLPKPNTPNNQPNPSFARVPPHHQPVTHTSLLRDIEEGDIPPQPPKKKGRPHPLKTCKAWFHRLSKKQKILFGVGLVIALLLIAGGGVFAYRAMQKKPAPKPIPVIKKVEEKPPEPPKPTTEASRLTGVQISPELNKRPITGIMIENSPDARPQAGLKDAGVVFEAVAEGGITRFLAVFQESQPDYIGPVRSARPYYLDWILPFDGAYGHVGGSPDALAQIKSQGVKDIDQFANSAYYRRVSNRFAPHNVYTSMAKLDELKTKKGYTTSNFTGFSRKAEAPANPATIKGIDLVISSSLYNVHYDYDPASNSYLRFEGGKSHIDEKSGAQLSPKVVVALVLTKGIASDGVHSTYQTTGSGPMTVFQDGIQIPGTWTKADRKAQYVFKDAQGAPLKLNPGQTWLTMVGVSSAISAKP